MRENKHKCISINPTLNHICTFIQLQTRTKGQNLEHVLVRVHFIWSQCVFKASKYSQFLLQLPGLCNRCSGILFF